MKLRAMKKSYLCDWLKNAMAKDASFYRRRAQNTGKKAGNVEEFFEQSGGAYDYALILDADSLMEGQTILEMIRRMEAEPRLGLLQTLPKIIRAQTRFGRAMQFAASFYSPVFCRGLAMLQGETGPFWGHNAIVRVQAFVQSCGLPVLRGTPPFGGHIMSHDYVEAALLARAGWIVRVDDDLEGSFEEGPENVIDHGKRDRRWCQGNLQHARVITAPGLKAWSRFVFAQGIMAYIAPLFWLAFLLVSILAPYFDVQPDYFPEANWPIPYIPPSMTFEAISLLVGIFGLLLLPKLLVAVKAAWTGQGLLIRRHWQGLCVNAHGSAALFPDRSDCHALHHPLCLSGIDGQRRWMANQQSWRWPIELARMFCSIKLDFSGRPLRPDDRLHADTKHSLLALAGRPCRLPLRRSFCGGVHGLVPAHALLSPPTGSNLRSWSCMTR